MWFALEIDRINSLWDAQNEFLIPPPPCSPLFPLAILSMRWQTACCGDTLSHRDTFHFAIVWFENKYENSFHLPASGRNFAKFVFFLSHFCLIYLFLFARRVSFRAMSHRVVSYRIVLSRVTDHVNMGLSLSLSLSPCAFVLAKIHSRSGQAYDYHYLYLFRWEWYWLYT